jgi:arsenate reductase
MEKSRVLFMCTGNSCRSQMGEALVNFRYSDKWNAFSAGSHPAGQVNPLTFQVLAEIGIDHHGRSKSIEEFNGQAFDLVVTMCDQAENECPVWLGGGRKFHLHFPDPSEASGSEAEKLASFRSVLEAIEVELDKLF